MKIIEQYFKYIKLVKHQGSFFSFAAIPQETKDRNGNNTTYLELYFNPTKTHINDINQQKLPAGDDLWTSYQKLVFPTEYAYARSSLINYKITSIRSQNKDVPLDSRDTFWSKNLNGQEFIKPTTQLNLKYEVENGNFTVQILPSSEFKSQENWHFFTLLTDGKTVNAYCIPRRFGHYRTGLWKYG